MKGLGGDCQGRSPVLVLNRTEFTERLTHVLRRSGVCRAALRIDGQWRGSRAWASRWASPGDGIQGLHLDSFLAKRGRADD